MNKRKKQGWPPGLPLWTGVGLLMSTQVFGLGGMHSVTAVRPSSVLSFLPSQICALFKHFYIVKDPIITHLLWDQMSASEGFLCSYSS